MYSGQNTQETTGGKCRTSLEGTGLRTGTETKNPRDRMVMHIVPTATDHVEGAGGTVAKNVVGKGENDGVDGGQDDSRLLVVGEGWQIESGGSGEVRDRDGGGHCEGGGDVTTDESCCCSDALMLRCGMGLD